MAERVDFPCPHTGAVCQQGSCPQTACLYDLDEAVWPDVETDPLELGNVPWPPQWRIGSLFAGIGGLELGLERAGVGRTVWQVEKDEFCRRVLARHWPDAVRYEDVTEVDWSTVEPVEVLCGGFPCQDISLAGKGAGLAGERSGLWREYLRAIRDLRPRFVVVENVAALLARGLGDVLADLAESGYDTEWDCIPAAAVGAPHRRDRLFVVAYPVGHGLRVESVAERRGSGAPVPVVNGPAWNVADPNIADGEARQRDGVGTLPRPGDRQLARSCGAGGARLVADPDDAGRLEQRWPVAARTQQSAAQRGGWWGAEPDVGRVAHGVPARVDRLRALGNAVVPQVSEVVGRRLLDIAAERAA